MLLSIFGLTTFPTERPTSTSAPTMASSRVCRSRSVVNSFFSGVRFSRSDLRTPLLSHMTIFSFFTPSSP